MEVLILSKRKALYDLSKVIQATDTCYYLSDDYLTLVKIRKSINNKYDVLTLGITFHKAIKEIEKDFLYFCHKINFKNQSEAYWGSQLASRNSASIPLLKHLVYFHCAKEILVHARSRIILVCDSPALMKVIRNEAKDQGFSCQVKFLPSESLNSLRIYLKVFLRGVYFLVSGMLRWFYARSLKNERIGDQAHKKRYLLRSWVTTGSLDREGRYKDRNFGVLPEYLTQQGIDVWILPMFFNLDKSVCAQMKLMSQSSQDFTFPEQYISILDLLKALRDGIKTVSLELAGVDFEGRDVSPVVKEIHLENSLSPQLMSLNSVKYLLQKFAKKEVKIDRFIYPIENNMPEKPFILAARRCYPCSKIVGFQHTVWYKEQLGMYLNPEELNYHPLPDQIVCSGSIYINILQKAGFPRKLLCLGPNLRYTAINENVMINKADESDVVKSVFIILNYDTNQSFELLEKTGQVLKDLENIKIFIKAHPITSVRSTEYFLEDIDFPSYEWVFGTVQDCLVQAHAVVMTGGSVSNLETIATGMPLIRISLENNFDFDCLWDEYPFADFKFSSSQIRQNLQNALQLDSKERKKLTEFGRKMTIKYFEPVTQENLKVFL